MKSLSQPKSTQLFSKEIDGTYASAIANNGKRTRGILSILHVPGLPGFHAAFKFNEKQVPAGITVGISWSNYPPAENQHQALMHAQKKGFRPIRQTIKK